MNDTTVSLEPNKLKNDGNNTRVLIIVGVVIAAIAVVATVIFLNNQATAVTTGKFDYANLPTSRTADGAFVVGDPNAPITIVEFADFLCPHCQEYDEIIEQVMENHVLTGQAKFEYRYFLTVDSSGSTARLVECAAGEDPVKFWQAHDLMYSLTIRGWNQESPREFSDQLGLNYGELLNCVRTADQFETDIRLGQLSEVNGTPAIRVRYGNSDGVPQPISEAYVRGGVTYQVIAAAILSVQAAQ